MSADQIYLRNQDRITGNVLSFERGVYQIETQALGTIRIEKQFVDRVVTARELVADTTKKEEEAKKIKRWRSAIEIGANRRRGNVNSTQVDAGFKTKRKTEKTEFDLQGKTYYSEEGRRMNAQKHFAMIRLASSFGQSSKWYRFVKSEVDHDRFGNIDVRMVPTVGIGYWFFDTEELKTMVEVGAGAAFTKFRDETKERGEFVLTPHVFIEKKLFGKSKIIEDMVVYPSLSEGEYRLKSETIFDNPITDQLSLQFALIDEYNSAPGGEAKKNDVTITSSLVYSY